MFETWPAATHCCSALMTLDNVAGFRSSRSSSMRRSVPSGVKCSSLSKNRRIAYGMPVRLAIIPLRHRTLLRRGPLAGQSTRDSRSSVCCAPSPLFCLFAGDFTEDDAAPASASSSSPSSTAALAVRFIANAPSACKLQTDGDTVEVGAGAGAAMHALAHPVQCAQCAAPGKV